MPKAREKLKAACSAVEKLAEDVRTLETTVSAATATLAQATADLATFDDLETEITNWRVSAMKQAQPVKMLPDHLQARKNAKRDAEEELAQAAETLQIVAEELEAAKARVKPFAKACQNAAADYLVELAEPLAQELKTLNRRSYEVSFVLRGLRDMSFWDGDQYVRPTQTTVFESAWNDQDDEFPVTAIPKEHMASRWRDRLKVLIANPDADIVPPKAVLPSDLTVDPRSDKFGLRPETGGAAA